MPSGEQLVRQQADPLQEEHRQGAGGGQHVRGQGGGDGGILLVVYFKLGGGSGRGRSSESRGEFHKTYITTDILIYITYSEIYIFTPMLTSPIKNYNVDFTKKKLSQCNYVSLVKPCLEIAKSDVALIKLLYKKVFSTVSHTAHVLKSVFSSSFFT